MDDIDILLSMVENPTRRRILESLVREPSYPLRLSKELGVPVVPITAKTGEGLDELLQVAHRQMHLGVTYEPDDLYDDFTHDIHHRMGELIHDYAYAANLPAHWASIKLLEGDELVERALALPEPVPRRRAEQAGRHHRRVRGLQRPGGPGDPGGRQPLPLY